MRRLTALLGVITLVVVMVVIMTSTIVSQPRPDSSLQELVDKFSLDDFIYLEELRSMNQVKMLNTVWLDICAMNRATHPDSNVVQPGDTLQLPLGQTYVAKWGGDDHMWRAAANLMLTVVNPYLDGDAKRVMSDDTASIGDSGNTNAAATFASPDWSTIAIIVLVVALLALGGYLLNQRELNKKFVVNPPEYAQTEGESVRPMAERALRTAFGEGIQIVGPIVKGRINGKLTMFNRDGSTVVTTFHNEEGYQTQILFEDGQVRTVVSRWSCFNPCYNCTGAEFDGTFTPAGSETRQPVPRMSFSQVVTAVHNIRNTGHSASSTDLPVSSADTIAAVKTEISRSEAPEVTPTATASATVETLLETAASGMADLTKLQFFKDGGVVMEGRLKLPVKDLKDMLYQITGRHPKDLESAKPDAPAPKVDAPAKADVNPAA